MTMQLTNTFQINNLDFNKTLRKYNLLTEPSSPEVFFSGHKFVKHMATDLRPGDIFICLTSHKKISRAQEIYKLSQNHLVITDEPLAEQPNILYVKNARAAWTALSFTSLLDNKRLPKIIGITGTNGKTSTTRILSDLLRASNQKVLEIGTLGYGLDSDHLISTGHTTPDPPVLHKLLLWACHESCDYVVMEVSSHSVQQQKINHLTYVHGVFTSFSQDHLDYHNTMSDYLNCKLNFLLQTANHGGELWINSSLKECSNLLENFYKKTHWYGLEEMTSYSDDLQNFYKKNSDAFLGDYNKENFLVSLLVAYFEIKKLPKNKQIAPYIPGRLEHISKNPDVYIDFAHTPDGLSKAIEAILKPNRKLILVFGCGGDRDKSKRPLMGEIASKFADTIYLTSDNPRSENPLDIIDDIQKGLTASEKVIIEPLREQAIKKALSHASPNDIILIAGKGHETTQTIGNEVKSFSDKQEALKWLSTK
jgi:UDP-N-acetylmuramoyl-L-alanyl-D-glutamate--2,6-diaminopimelate ligase